jgi:hypothetical protein
METPTDLSMAVTRKRRRILIATLLVVGVLGVWWKFRPRLDKRFLGRWVINLGGSGERVQWTETKTFNLDGTMMHEMWGPEPRELHWRIEGGSLVEYDPASDFPAPLVEFYRWLTSDPLIERSRSQYRIISIGDDEIRLSPVESRDPDPIDLVRFDSLYPKPGSGQNKPLHP